MEVTFSYPYFEDIDTQEIIHLSAPELNEVDERIINIVAHKTLNDTVKIVPVDVSVKVIRTLLLFKLINPNKINEMREFIRKAQNEYVRYIDYNGEEWVCIIVEPSFNVLTSNRDEYGDFSITLNKWKET